MACRFEIALGAADARHVPAAQEALNQIDAIESQLTVFRPSSVIADVNRRAATEPVPVDADVRLLLSHALDLAAATGGAFDITSTPLSRCWGFLRREGRLPSRDDIAQALACVGSSHVTIDRARSAVRFAKPGVELNLGAIGKGHALDRVASTLRARGVRHTLLSAGQSSLLAIGGRGRGWPIDVVSPRREPRIARVRLCDAALGTSGAGEQFVVVDGTRYGHVIDPRTGWPTTAMLSASVITARAADADALSTAFLVGGPDLASRYCDRHRGVLALVTPDDGSGRTFAIGARRGVEVES